MSQAVADQTSEPVLHLPSIHFSNGPEIFSISPAQYTEMEVRFKRLAQRSLLMAGPEDTIILNRPPDEEYLSILNACGAGGHIHLTPESDGGTCLAEDLMTSTDSLDYIGNWQGQIETYMVSRFEEKLSAKTPRSIVNCSSSVTALLNDKVLFTRLVEDLGLPYIETFIGPPDAVSAKVIRDTSGPIIVKRASSLGGFGVWVALDARQRQRLGKDIEKFRSGMFLLQPYIKTACSPNLQYYLGSDNICLLGQTIQNLRDGISHFGNIFDPVDDKSLNDSLLEQGKQLALETALMGYRGILGIDFIISTQKEVFPVELNARHNTSTHALWFINRFINGNPFIQVDPGLASFLQVESNQNLSAMEWIKLLGQDAFDPGTGYGILPYDCRNENFEVLISGKDRDHRDHLTAIATLVAGE